MADNASRRGATNLSMPLMIAAVAVIGGFLFWLNGQTAMEMAERQATADSIAAAEEERRATPGVTTVAASALQMDATPYEGQRVRVEDLPVASTLGSQGYWLEMPNRNPFLVSISDQVRNQGVTAEPGDLATVEGMVVAINDSVLTAWTEAGTIAEGDRLAAEFATHFIEASRLQVEAGGAGDGGAQGGANQGDGAQGGGE
jgi:hypothetical protein